MNQHITVDVAIAGYGPVGQTLAILLGQIGYSVAVFERWPALYPLPRAVFHDHEIRRVFLSMGLGEELAKISQPSARYQWFNADWKVLVEIDWSAESISDGPFGYLFNQPLLEAALDRKAKSIDTVQIHQGWEASALKQDADGCDMLLNRVIRQDGKFTLGEEQRSVRARYVIGADGANSFVRQSLNIEWQDLGFQEDWLVVDLQPKSGVELDVPDIGQWCNPERPTTMVPGGPGFRRWEFMRLPHETLEELQDTDKVWSLLSRWVTPQTADLVRHAVYQFRSRIAAKWHSGRVMIAGDAAHVMPPFMGQGMCSGIRDAWNLSWRLDLMLRGLADNSLLDSYTLERKPQIRAVIEASMAMGKVVCVSDPVKAAERDAAYLSGNVAPLPPFPGLTGGLLQEESPVRGILGVHGSIEIDGHVNRYDDVIQRGFHLLVRGDEDPLAQLDAQQLAFIRGYGLQVVRLASQSDSAKGIYRDVSGKYLQFMAEAGLKAVIVRPDYYCYGGVAELSALPKLLNSLRQQLQQNVDQQAAVNDARACHV
ncbi:bifunctional 3-(3-hydroxy-phenyl)propionate/3-hydroxycinnamic acid hydroxylase [Pseudomonas sp. TH08]|uniref:bifunctional 3-(3-hydroxy-phenyl)propionate/3-hydroxycinnamic acid hydroxylase MhpA n=1 Tax=unclassified Pseudomonas TaxID=196821 RepID=UPI001912555E|nr:MULTISPECIES: bifunctional 3-(3-hydroxy-phenyl)propionate/3-hydroxycinnamic acid hydroxylase [unclassified Pseudomonas]MBK5529653.1 bifunctional 3-(3-hydroxy-phenyl)propionate/3-hydroxycinnamic acid hydroxylase [Pseudomonas sp. TH06]MBK5534756.1 bifunctional 3-(3-hydroxy-phenyl)propionate/3-hydroxycinnamic acid hydroxylase [Pseudomonas sp. TH08]